MAKKFTTKKMRLRARSLRRRQQLRVVSPAVSRKPTLEEQNRSVIAAIEAKMQAENA